ncbi:AMP-binding domain-containing protein [Fusarium acuminatum]|uniref:AMP-binding domain-containing protein n=1 Tax=Fusarium acuminatum TaxID=5515 RepID=A0ABZ2WXS9_9HYPO
MSTFKTPSSELQASAKKYPNLAVFKLPQQSATGTTYKDISFLQFQKDVEASARYWKDQLRSVGVQERAVVGVWLKGHAYKDAVHIWGLNWAGFIPQLVSLNMTNPSVIYELLERAEAKALIHEPGYASILENCPFPNLHAGDVVLEEDVKQLPSLVPWQPADDDDALFIYHTSGSTSGIPKLVPITARWINYVIGLSGLYEARANMSRDRMVSLHIGNFCHMAASFLTWFTVREGSCTILPTVMPYPISEVQQLLDEQGLSTVCMFPPYLSALLRQARKEPSLLESLKKADVLGSGGLDPDPVDEAWGRSQGFHMLNVMGSTEAGVVMMNDSRETSGYLEMIPGTKNEFIPVDKLESGEELLELVLPADAPNCPVSNLRSADGKFHTGDLFIEVALGKYLCKGRNDNWIKMTSGGRTDTLSIEVNVMETCGDDLVNAVVVVGVKRPCPTIVIEPKDKSLLEYEGADVEASVQRLKEDVLRRITPFHQRRYTHERIEDTRYIIVVPQGTLPRTVTKGNIRRQEVEKVFKPGLDAIYAEKA